MDLRIGDAERDSVAEALHDHFAKGRLTREELDERLDSALAARTEADLREIVRDLPAPNGLPEPAPPAGPPVHWRAHRRGPGPLVPLLLAFFLIAVLGSGASGVLLAVQLLFLFWLATAVFAVKRRRTSRLYGCGGPRHHT